MIHGSDSFMKHEFVFLFLVLLLSVRIQLSVILVQFLCPLVCQLFAHVFQLPLINSCVYLVSVFHSIRSSVYFPFTSCPSSRYSCFIVFHSYLSLVTDFLVFQFSQLVFSQLLLLFLSPSVSVFGSVSLNTKAAEL